MANIFNAGDVVNLVSGGPDMTVEKVRNEPLVAPNVVPEIRVHCVWFSEGGAFAFGNFSPDVLVGKSAGPTTAAAAKTPAPLGS